MGDLRAVFGGREGSVGGGRPAVELTRGTLPSAAVAAGVWLVSGLAQVLFASNVVAARALGAIVPTPTNAVFWAWTPPWAWLGLLFGAVTVAAITTLVLEILSCRARGGITLAGAWLAVVVAGAVTGLAIDAIQVLPSIPVVGWRAILSTTVNFAVIGAYWGLVLGWIPAIIASRRRAQATDAPPSAPPRPSDAPYGPAVVPSPSEASEPTGGRLLIPLGAAVVACVAFLLVGILGAEAYRTAVAAEQAATEAAEAADAGGPAPLGAAPDGAAPGTPPATVAPSPETRDPSWCTPDQAMLLSGEKDAATGHRVLSIRLMNVSEAPCVLEGYPDIAFADQNGEALDVTVERGSSFMAEDAGAQRIEIPAHGYAIARIGWDANSTHGALVAATLYAAMVAGDERGSWPVSVDITEGSTVELTAWQLDTAFPSTW